MTHSEISNYSSRVGNGSRSRLGKLDCRLQAPGGVGVGGQKVYCPEAKKENAQKEFTMKLTENFAEYQLFGSCRTLPALVRTLRNTAMLIKHFHVNMLTQC